MWLFCTAIPVMVLVLSHHQCQRKGEFLHPDSYCTWRERHGHFVHLIRLQNVLGWPWVWGNNHANDYGKMDGLEVVGRNMPSRHPDSSMLVSTNDEKGSLASGMSILRQQAGKLFGQLLTVSTRWLWLGFLPSTCHP